jgi:hypothetical protein
MRIAMTTTTKNEETNNDCRGIRGNLKKDIV